MYRTDDPLADFDRHQMEQERLLARRPQCCHCDEHITDDFAYYINGEWICEMCMDREYRQAVPEE